MKLIKTLNDDITSTMYGSKAYWLSWLTKHGYNVPFAVFFPAVESFKELINFGIDVKLLASLLSPMREGKIYNVAVRSSATCEDTKQKSFAGHFQTLSGRMEINTIFDAISHIVDDIAHNYYAPHCKMGIIIQKKINTKTSGVAFSSNPITGEINQSIISITTIKLIDSGSLEKKEEDITITIKNNKQIIPSYKTNIDQDILIRITQIIKEIEEILQYPVDIEWCIEEGTGELYILQCRPATGIWRENDRVIPITQSNVNKIPTHIITDTKISIRLQAEKDSIPISPAYLVLINQKQGKLDIPSLDNIVPSPSCKEYSVVLLSPKTVEGQVIRLFSDRETLQDSIEKITQKTRGTYWTSIIIVKEIFDSQYTGIIKKINDGYVVEIGLGHFIPKGIVSTSQYIVDLQGVVTHSKEITPNRYFQVSGSTVIEVPLINASPLSIPKNEINKIVRNFAPFLANQKISLEFEIIKNKNESNYDSYAIDTIEESEYNSINSEMIIEGVISSGTITGELTIHNQNPSKAKTDFHFHDQRKFNYKESESKVFLCERADISLLDIIHSHNPHKIGFIFREASVLSHLAIILREHEIPAILIDRDEDIPNHTMLTIDASSPGLTKKERIKYKKTNHYVFSYVNPDSDGICSSIGYSFLINMLTGIYFEPLAFGTLNNETIFILKNFNVDYIKINPNVDFKNSKIAIMDTHHLNQLNINIPTQNVIEIIDHHPSGDPDAFPNAKIQNEKVGAVATIIAEKIKTSGITPSINISGLLLAAIISNTLNFTAPSTSPRDISIANWLRTFVHIDESFISEMFSARSDIKNKPTKETLLTNYKEYTINNIKIGISQVELIDLVDFLNKADLIDNLLEIKQDREVEHIILNLIDLSHNKSLLVCPQKDTQILLYNILRAEFQNGLSYFSRILLRKTDLIPKLQEFFSSNS